MYYSHLFFVYPDCKVFDPINLKKLEKSHQLFVLKKAKSKRVPEDYQVEHESVYNLYCLEKGVSVFYVRLHRRRTSKRKWTFLPSPSVVKKVLGYLLYKISKASKVLFALLQPSYAQLARRCYSALHQRSRQCRVPTGGKSFSEYRKDKKPRRLNEEKVLFRFLLTHPKAMQAFTYLKLYFILKYHCCIVKKSYS